MAFKDIPAQWQQLILIIEKNHPRGTQERARLMIIWMHSRATFDEDAVPSIIWPPAAITAILGPKGSGGILDISPDRRTFGDRKSPVMTSNLQVKMMWDLTMRCLYPAVRIWGSDIAGLWTSRSRKAASSLFRASSQSGQSDLDLAFLRLVGAKSLPVGSRYGLSGTYLVIRAWSSAALARRMLMVSDTASALRAMSAGMALTVRWKSARHSSIALSSCDWSASSTKCVLLRFVTPLVYPMCTQSDYDPTDNRLPSILWVPSGLGPMTVPCRGLCSLA